MTVWEDTPVMEARGTSTRGKLSIHPDLDAAPWYSNKANSAVPPCSCCTQAARLHGPSQLQRHRSAGGTTKFRRRRAQGSHNAP